MKRRSIRNVIAHVTGPKKDSLKKKKKTRMSIHDMIGSSPLDSGRIVHRYHLATVHGSPLSCRISHAYTLTINSNLSASVNVLNNKGIVSMGTRSRRFHRVYAVHSLPQKKILTKNT